MSPLNPNLPLTNHNSQYSYSKLFALTLAVLFYSGLLPAQSKINNRDLAIRTQPTSKSSSSLRNSLYFYTEELSFNTTANEYASGFYDNKLIVVSDRKVNRSKNSLFDQSELKLLGFVKNQNKWERPHLLPGIFTGNENHGGLTFSTDLTRVFYTKSSTKNPASFELYTANRSSKHTNLWKNPNKAYNVRAPYSVENPWLSASGELLFFASNQPGGYGGYDIYVAKVYADGHLGKPKNLGPQINTAADENYPSLNAYGTQFYFASTKTGGFGGYDLYRSYTNQGDYSYPKNLGHSLNTSANEVGLIPVSETTGYFSSDKNSLDQKGLNIYSFQMQ